MFGGTRRRIICMWFPRLASDRALRACPVEGPFVLSLLRDNAERIHCLNAAAGAAGLGRGMSMADARALYPALLSRPARPDLDARFLMALRRWATRYCPWVGRDGPDGLVLDITGAAHLQGGEAALIDDMRARTARAGLSLRIGCAGTRGAAWALAHFGEEGPDTLPPGNTTNRNITKTNPAEIIPRRDMQPALRPIGPPVGRAADRPGPAGTCPPEGADPDISGLPVAALRLDPETVVALQRLGLRRVGDLAAAARAPLARRFGPGLLTRLDQAMGDLPEPVTPEAEPPHYGLRLTLPDPIGLIGDVMAALDRLLPPLCDRLAARQVGARTLCLTLRRVDRQSRDVELRLAMPLRDPARLRPLFERAVGEVDAGYGIDQLRLVATRVEPLRPRQEGGRAAGADEARLDDLVTRLGTRIGIGNILRLQRQDSHIPERAFTLGPALAPPGAGGGSRDGHGEGNGEGNGGTAPPARPDEGWSCPVPRPLRMFPPEPITGHGNRPPGRFTWRRMALDTLRATGPERIAPEWWRPDPAPPHGLRDYWRVETRQGLRLWLFHIPRGPEQASCWYVQGEFP